MAYKENWLLRIMKLHGVSEHASRINNYTRDFTRRIYILVVVILQETEKFRVTSQGFFNFETL